MKRHLIFLGFVFLLLSLGIISMIPSSKNMSVFNRAIIRMDEQEPSAIDIRFEKTQGIPLAIFFEQYRQAFRWSAENEAKPFRIFTDKLGQTHHRFKQYYKGIELAEIQYLLHEKDGLVFHAHGKLIHGLAIDTRPAISESEALQKVLQYIQAESYLWENPKTGIYQQLLQQEPLITQYPRGELKISAGHKEKLAQNFRLVYRFDIFALKPFSRNYVDVDAHSGEIIAAYSRINHRDVQGQGLSVYNGMVPITVSDSDYPTIPLGPSRWHLDSWQAYTGQGESWWMADPTLGDAGGYGDRWYEVLDSDPIMISGSNPVLSFYHRYWVETPAAYQEYDGWDGMNVRISADQGETWQVLMNPVPAYTCSSLAGFGSLFQEGIGIPGWADQLAEWHQVTFDLADFTSQTVQLRFAFASDWGYSTATSLPQCFGWQIDDIYVFNTEDTLFSNTGSETGFIAKNNYREVTEIPGNYRLREEGRGNGIFTYNSMGDYELIPSVDFVDEDSLFTDEEDKAGVSLHWALEGVYDYYFNKHGRNSYDEQGGRLLAYANQIFYYSPDSVWYPNNAMWSGSFSLYGVGDGTYWGPWVSLDVVGHEITHGVTQYSANLTYANESGGLNESFSDIFGTALEFFKEGSNGDWLMGEDIGDITNKNLSVRSLQFPKSDYNPDTYQGEYWVMPVPDPNQANDYGGVHTNCGVQNYWFYLLCQGGSGSNDKGSNYMVNGIGLQDAEQIAYRNLTVYLMPTSQYADARQGSIDAAEDLFGKGSQQAQAVTDAWYAVGVGEPFNGIYARSTLLNSKYQHPALDSLWIFAKVNNPENHQLKVRGIIESFDLSITDTVDLFDDGMHKDSTASDNFFAGTWKVPEGERNYTLHLSTQSIDSGFYNLARNVQRFTSIGPLIIEKLKVVPTSLNPDTIANAGERLKYQVSLRNAGSSATATNITAKIYSLNDSLAKKMQDITFSFGDIAPDETVVADQNQYIHFAPYLSGQVDCPFQLEMASEGYVYWTETFVITNVEPPSTEAPLSFALHQNYPNPFNPKTVIRYALPVTCQAELSIYNILGQKVATLVNEKQLAGSYQVEWQASGFSNGVYLYRLTSDQGFVQTRKLVLLK